MSLENTGRKIARAIPYYRVSTDDQSLGIEAQRDQVAAYCSRHGLDLVGPFEDEGVSGATPIEKRPGLLAALAEVRPGDILIVAKRDRIGRDPVIVAMIESMVGRAGGRVASAAGEGTDGDDPASILMRRIIDGFAEYERLVIKGRTRAALAALRKRGRRTGTIPYGFTAIDDGQLTKTGKGPGRIVEAPGETRIFERIAALDRERLSPRAIARALDAEGISTRKGKPWHHSTVRLILSRIRHEADALAIGGRDHG